MTGARPPVPDAAWSTVCFQPAHPGGRLHGGGPHDRWSLAVWRSDTADGQVLVRSDPLSRSARGPGHPCHPSCPHPPGGPLPCDVHLWVDADSPRRPALLAQADVLVSRVPLPPGAARRRVLELLAAHPGCLAAAVPDTATTCAVAVRHGAAGPVSFVRPSRGRPPGAPLPPRTIVSVVHAWTVAGRSPGALRRLTPMPLPLPLPMPMPMRRPLH
ncbi:hypothetical protein ACH3Y9_24955 [Streptomyces sp. WSLK1-5]|uniref:hypothetical protein n=1 Tax=unclassified Streptomyces TaxID=2593676 RepID=UPI0037B5C3DD